MHACFFVAVLVGVVTSSLPCDTSSAVLKAITQSSIASLKERGFEVEEGQFLFLTNSTTFGANPGNPYGVYQFGTSRLGMDWQLGTQDALMFVGCTPPSVAYFSWRSYVGTHARTLEFASLGDSLNNLVINTSNPSSSSGACGKAVAVITTADATTHGVVADALVGAGLPTSAVNLDSIPSSLLTMGMGLGKDRFIMLHRASVWNDTELRKEYFNLTRPVYRITAPPAPQPARPFPVPVLRPQGTGSGERQIPGLVAALASLNTSVVAYMQAKYYSLVGVEVLVDFPLNGFQCIKEGTDCLGDNHDTHYVKTSQGTALGSSDVVVVVGTNSVETGKCTYTNIGLYHSRTSSGSLSSTQLTADNRLFPGTTEFFADGSIDPALVTRLFAYGISRDCKTALGVGPCLAVTEEDIPTGDFMEVIYRPYLEPATRTAPKIEEIISPVLLRFRRTSPALQPRT